MEGVRGGRLYRDGAQLRLYRLAPVTHQLPAGIIDSRSKSRGRDEEVSNILGIAR